MPVAPRIRSLALGLSVALAVAACTSVAPEDLSVPLPEQTTTSTAAPQAQPDTAPDDDGDLAGEFLLDFDGLLAIGGLPGLVITEPGGTLAANSPPDLAGLGQQPTWSRDGQRAVAFLPDGAGGNVTVVSDSSSWVSEARRNYFFFSWSGDGRYIAALGPGPGGTTLDILTADGSLATAGSIDTASFYLAWEPGGAELVVHLDEELFLVRDPLDLETLEPLGTPGQSFLAPAWIPETRDIVIVDEADDGRLIQLNVDDGSRVDLGPVGGAAGFVVSPDGSRLFLTHSGPNAERGDDILISNRGVQDDESISASEIVVLGSGRRVAVNDELTLWAEWAPTGDALAMLQPGDRSGEWRIFDETGVRSLGASVSTPTFFRNYVFFAWQFVESPRIWAPDGDAIVYAALDGTTAGIYVHPIDGREHVRVSDGDVAFWSPSLEGGAPSPA